MNSTTKGVVTILALAAVAGGVWFLLLRNKKRHAATIVKEGKSANYSTLLTFDEPFLRAWAKAAKAGNDTFTFEGKTYNTDGGKVK